ncbi:hypothetical protein AB8O55_22495 [Saccharopolyspora cebuensis]|uniref:HPr kinase/phosphorylase C-terminal domain-containing protein n=1 Tax=Saccharopolyspora cebuensis TaxID=418759 RepID=A0ABV4CPY1_9PSEU
MERCPERFHRARADHRARRRRPDRYTALAADIDHSPHEVVDYARAPLHLGRSDDGAIRAHGDHVAYRIDSPRSITITGTETTPVASAASRLVRETLRGHLARAGWVLMHASAAVDLDGRAVLAFGGKGAGKTTTAFQLAAASGWSLLANDRIFARPTDDGAVQILPWPAACALGLGFLHAMGWSPAVAAARDELHTSTTAAVQAALAAGSREPLWSGPRELKPQLYPDQLTSLCGLPLASHATAAGILLPAIAASATPAVTPPEADSSTTPIRSPEPRKTATRTCSTSLPARTRSLASPCSICSTPCPGAA